MAGNREGVYECTRQSNIRWRESRANASPPDPGSERKRNWSQQIRQTNVAIHFRPNAISHSVDDLRAVLRGIDVHTERTFTKGHVHHVDNSFGDIGHISIGRRGSSEPLHDVVTKMRVRSVVVLVLTRLVCWCNGMRGVIRCGGGG